MNIRVLHLSIESEPLVRLQRYLQSNINMGIQPIVLCRERTEGKKKKEVNNNAFWIPDRDKISIQYYRKSRVMTYLSPIVYDEIGLKSIFNKYGCDFVHAHYPETAYYSYKLGLPTVFDDYEYWLEFLDFWGKIRPEPTLPRIQSLINARNLSYSSRVNAIARTLSHSSLPVYLKRKRMKRIVKELIQKVPLIVTNEEVERKYRELGVSSIYTVPNVPLTYEREYAFSIEKKKAKTVTTCYIGNMTSDKNFYLRNTTGIKELWDREKLGSLYIFEGKNYLPHLEVLRKVRECHFNLLFWKPLKVHRYFLQNKAFLASVVGVPTIISSSLKATINLLGDFALPVNSLDEIPDVIRNYDYSKEYALNPAHLWEYYEPRIKAAYEDVLDRSRK